MNNTKKTIIAVFALVAVIACAALIYSNLSSKVTIETVTSDNQQSVVGKAPDFTVTDVTGNPIKLSDKTGKPVIVNVWASWCSPCKEELPLFNKLYHEYGEDVEFMMVNLNNGAGENAENVTAFVTENGYSFPVYFDSSISVAQAYGINSIPRTLVIDRDGNLVDTHIGDLDEQTLRAYLEKIVGTR